MAGRSGRRGRPAAGGVFGVLAALVAAALATGPGLAAGDQNDAVGTGLPLPRFASLKYDHVNVRRGPDRDNDVVWVYTRTALPVEITEEFENWRRIRDRDGSEGWVHHTLLSGKRTAYVARARPLPQPQLAASRPAAPPDFVPVYAAADPASGVQAMLEPGVVASVRRCDGRWCRLAGPGFDGFVDQNQLWGVYPNEKIE